MKRTCPNLKCSQNETVLCCGPKTIPIIRKGYYYRRSDGRRISRYFCRICGHTFSSATTRAFYKSKRREIHSLIFQLFSSGVSQRRAAKILKINPKTSVRKFRMWSKIKEEEHGKWLKTQTGLVTEVQFDDLETSEHTKCKPLSVALAVNKKTREILSFKVSRMPAKGHLAKIARLKYGYRKDERSRGWEQMFRDLESVVAQDAHFESDENPHYSRHLRKYFKFAIHTPFPGARGAIAGQGELKKLKRDPLFSLNHTCAMLRANLNRLFRRTWCTTKTIQGLIDHLNIYVAYHNQVLIPAKSTSKGGS